MAVEIDSVQFHVLNMHTRMPFRYGIASLVALPHLFVRMVAKVDGVTSVGLSSEGLPPKWFTKDPETRFEQDLVGMLEVIRKAAFHAQEAGTAQTVFDLWQHFYGRQKNWASGTDHPPLLWAFGVSLMERALIDAFCRAKETPFREAVHANTLGIRLGDIHPVLGDAGPHSLLPETPTAEVDVRHTVGLTDPLTDAEIPVDERLDDGLPQSLESNLKVYGIRYLKIKLCGDSDRDLARLGEIAGMMRSQEGPPARFTLDGNEQYREVGPFRSLWESLLADADLRSFLEGLIFVEQPFHRDVALGDEVTGDLMQWAERPSMIIDESDGELDSAPRAMALGFAGTSHKNCKGVFKGIANACLMAHRRVHTPEFPSLLSSEDLANLGPVALPQDLAVLSCLGITHTERNGHHYFAGLSMFPADVQQEIVAAHGDLFAWRGDFAALDIRHGKLRIESAVEAPFGRATELDVERYTPLDDWSADSLKL